MLNNNGVYSISFNEVHNANKYNLVVFDSNNQEVLNRNVTSGGYNFSNEEILNMLSGNYTYMIKAMYEGNRYIINGDFQTKNNDKILSFCKLETPKNIKADKEYITWDISENASSYKIYVNDKESLSVVNKYLSTIVGSFTFKVKAVNTNNDDNFYIESNYSQEITFNKLPKVNIVLKNGKIEWDLITGANSYDVSINNKKIDFNIESGKGYVNISSLDKANKYTVTICAIADNDNNYLNSKDSVIFIINKLVAKNLNAVMVDNYLNITWDKEINSNGYILNINDGEDIVINDKNTTSYQISLNENNYNKVSIKYIGSDENNTLDSDVLTINITVNKCETINSEDILIQNDYLVFPKISNAGGYIIYAEKLNGSSYTYFNKFEVTTNQLYLFDKLSEGKYRFKVKVVGNKANSFDSEYSEYSSQVEKLKAPIDILIETLDNEDYSDYYKLSYVTSLSNPKFNIKINNKLHKSDIEGKDTLLKKSIFSGTNEYKIQLQVKGDNLLNTITSDYSYIYTVKMFNNLNSPEIFNSGNIYIDSIDSYVNIKPTFTIHIYKLLEDNSYNLVKSIKLGSGNLLNNRFFYDLSTLDNGNYKAYFTANINLDKKLYYVNDPIAVSKEINFTILKTPVLNYQINSETGKAEIIWDEVPNANSYFYELTVGGEIKDNGNINDLYYIPKLASLTENLEFKLTVKAIGSGTNINSKLSEVFTGIKLAKVKDVTLNSSNSPYILNWNDVNSGLYYDIYINGEKFATTEDNTYCYTFNESLFNETGNYKIQLISKPNNNNYFESSYSDYYTVTKYDNLEKAYIDEDKLYFIGGGSKFQITINNTDIINIDNTSQLKVFDISPYNVGDVFSIKDLGNGTNILPSSSSIEITYNPLSAVSNIRIENNKIVWDSVANSTGYKILIKNTNNITIEEIEVNNDILSYEFNENRPAGNYIFEIKALGNLVYSNSVYTKFNFIKSNIIKNLQLVSDDSDSIDQSKANLKWDYDGEFNGFLIEVKNNVTEEVFSFTVTTNSFSYNIDFNSLDSYSFRVKVIGKYENSYLDSNYSKSSNLIVQRIETVQNISSEKSIIKWDKITNAEHYQVIIINITTSETLYNDILTLNSIDISNLQINNNDEIQITIKPIGNGKNYLSGNTNIRNFTKLDVPTIKYIKNGIEINSEDISKYHIFLIKPDGTKEEITSLIKDKCYVIPQNYSFGQYSFEAYVDGQDGTLSSNVTKYSLILEKLQGVKNLRIENVKNASDDDYKTYLKWDYEDNDIKSKGDVLYIIIKYVDGSSRTLTFTLDKKEALLDGNVNLGKFDIEVYVSPKNNYVYSSNEVLTGYNKLNVDDIKIEIKDGVVTWNYINDILNYVITINDKVIFIENTNSLKLDDTTLNAVIGANNIKIKAIGDLNRKLISSNTSKNYTFEKLGTPEIIINNGYIQINNISDEIIKLNHIFEITEYVNGNYIFIDSLDYQNTLKFLSENYQTVYHLRLKLLGKNSKINSDYSNYLKVQALKTPKDLENNLPTVVKNNNSDSDWLLKWNVVENAKGYIITFDHEAGDYTYQSLIENKNVNTLAIPTESPAGNYKVTIIAYTTSDFSSYLINSDPVIYYFDKVEEPTLYLKNGVLYWNVVTGASYYNLFVNETMVYSGSSLNFDFKNFVISSKEYTNYCRYEVKLQAVSSESHGYISSVITPVYYILKPVEPGELTVKDGSLIWYTTGYNTYNSDCDILIELYDKDKNLLATQQVPRSYFINGFPRKDLKLSNLFKLSNGEKYYVRIAEIGSTVDKLNYELDNVYFVTSDFNDYKEIYINNAPKLSIFDNDIYIKDNKIIINVEIPNKFNEVVKYLIYVNDEFVYEITSSEAVNNLLTIDLENLNLSTGVDRNRDVKRISICMQGNTYVSKELTLSYVTGLLSNEQSITVLEKVYGLSTEDGKLKWNKVEGCNGYEIVVVNVEKGVTYTYTVGADENKFDHTTLIDNLLLPGENIIKVRALGNGETTTNGAFSTETRFIKLTNDVKLQVIEGKLAFEYDENFNYVLKIDDEPYLISKDEIEILEKNGVKYALVETKILDTNSHNYSVQVLGNTSQDLNKLYLTSDYSNTIKATMLTSIISIRINENGYITWKQEVTKNNGFKIYINDIFYSELFTLQDYLTSIPVLKQNGKEIILSGQIVFRVQAIGNSGTNGELYLNSRISLASLDAMILDPVKAFTLEEGKLTWAKVDNAYGYVINVYPQNGGSNFQIEVGNENGYYDISKDTKFLPGSSYKFGIYAKGNATDKTFNSFETKKNYKVENDIIYQDDLLAYKLNTPSSVNYISSADPYITWTLIENADSYEITLFNNSTNETRIFTSSTNQFMLKDAGLVSGNQYSITIRALSSNKDNLSFIYSNSSSAYIIQNPSTVSNFIYDDSNYKFTWDKDSNTTVKYKIYYTIYNLVNGKFVKVADHIKDVGYNNFFILEELGYYGNVYVRSYALDGLYSDKSDILFEQENYLLFNLFEGGSGTVNDPYLINSYTDLKNMEKMPNKYYLLNKDLDLTDITIDLFNDKNNPFNGNFDGNNKTITLKLISIQNKDITSVGGLLGYNQKEINNLNIIIADSQEDLKFNLSQLNKILNLGLIVGTQLEGGTISNCNISGSDIIISESNCGQINIGGIVGESNNGSVVNCTNNVNIKILFSNVVTNIGGIVGQNIESTISNCTNNGDLSGLVVGGIAGNSDKSSSILKCTNNGSITISVINSKQNLYYAGGIVGKTYGKIENCINNGKVSEELDLAYVRLGGIAGYNNGDNIYNCVAIGSLSRKGRNAKVGSIAGESIDSKQLYNNYCYSISFNAVGTGSGSIKVETFTEFSEIIDKLNNYNGGNEIFVIVDNKLMINQDI